MNTPEDTPTLPPMLEITPPRFYLGQLVMTRYGIGRVVEFSMQYDTKSTYPDTLSCVVWFDADNRQQSGASYVAMPLHQAAPLEMAGAHPL